MDAYVAKPLHTQELLAAIRGIPGASPEPAAAPRRVRTIDKALLLERVGGDRQALGKLAKFFLADSPKLLAQIRRAAQRGDAHALQAAAHALKGAVSNFAAPAATAAALRLQRMGEAGDLAEAKGASAILARELDQVGAALKKLLSTGSAGRAPRRRKPRR
jgi:HPt (histidine-containing phosphotransfer) domain-containing protein